MLHNPWWNHVRQALLDGLEQGRFHVENASHALVHVMGVLIFPLHAHAVAPMLDEWPLPLETEIAERTAFILRGLGMKAADQS